MTQELTAEIIAIGTELLLGEIVDTNSAHIARCLRDGGINVYYMISVGDNEGRIASILRHALSRADIVITCGGLGPTVDDVTRQAVARATDRELVFHQELLDQISARFHGFRVKMTENNRQQAYLPEGATVIENPVGTAPSYIIEHNDCIIISLPGVPREMKFLMANSVMPYLQERYHLGMIKARILQTAGIGESSLDDAIGRDILEQSNPTIGLAAHQGQVDVRITAKADSENEAERLLDETETKVRERIGEFVFGSNGERLEDVLVALLQKNQATLAIIEVGIDNAITRRIKSAISGSQVIAISKSFDHPDELLQMFPEDKRPAMRDLALDVARTLCEEVKATVSIAVISHPDMAENADEKQGTVIAVYSPQKSRVRVYGFGGKAEMASSWVGTWALSSAWRILTEALS